MSNQIALPRYYCRGQKIQGKLILNDGREFDVELTEMDEQHKPKEFPQQGKPQFPPAIETKEGETIAKTTKTTTIMKNNAGNDERKIVHRGGRQRKVK